MLEKLDTTIGKRLKDERERLKLTQKQVFEKLGLSERTYIIYEGNIGPSPSANSWKILAELGFDILYVLIGIKTPTEHLDNIKKILAK